MPPHRDDIPETFLEDAARERSQFRRRPSEIFGIVAIVVSLLGTGIGLIWKMADLHSAVTAQGKSEEAHAHKIDMLLMWKAEADGKKFTVADWEVKGGALVQLVNALSQSVALSDASMKRIETRLQRIEDKLDRP